MEPHPDHRTPATPVVLQISPPASLRGMTPSTWAPGTPASRLLLIQTSLLRHAHHGTATRACGTTRGTQGAGAAVHPGREAPGAVRVGLTQALHLGTPMISNHHGGTSPTSPRGVRGSLHFLHACRDLPISEGPSLPTSSLLLSTSPLHHHTVLGASRHALCRTTFLLDTTTTGHRTPHTALTTLREIILETCQVLLPITIPVRGSLHQEWGRITLHGVVASTLILARHHMASMAIRPTCVIGSILSKMTPAWCPMYPTLTCQPVSWLHLSNLRTTIINLLTRKTSGCPRPCPPVTGCWLLWKLSTALHPTIGPGTVKAGSRMACTSFSGQR